MPDPTHITVTAPPGRKTPVHGRDGQEPGGGLLYVTNDVVARIRYSQTTRRSIGRGDLVPCDMNGAATTVTLAAAPDDLPGGKIVLDRTASGKASLR